MDPKLVQEALDALIEEGAGDGKCAGILKTILAGLAAKGAGGDATPESIPEPIAKIAAEPMQGGGDSAVVQTDDARRAKGAEMDKDMARARKALLDGEAEVKRALEIIRPAAKTQVAMGLRARLGSAFTPAAEAEIMAAPDLAMAEALGGFAEKLLGGKGAGQERARSGIEHDQRQPPTTSEMPTVDALRTDGFTESWLTGYASALRSGPDVAAAFLEQGRASTRARVAKPNGGAS